MDESSQEPRYKPDMEAAKVSGYDRITGHSYSFLLYEQGKDLMAQSKYEDALRVLQKSYAEDIHAATLTAIGECYIGMGRLREAVEPLAASTTLVRTGKAPGLLAEILLQLGEIPDAVNAALISLERSPNYRRAVTVLKEGRVQQYLSELRMDFEPQKFGVNHPLNQLSRLYPETGMPP